MAKPNRMSLAAVDPLVVVVDRFDGSDAGRAAMALLHWAAGVARARALGPITAIVWERGPSGWNLPEDVTVHEIESINRWLLPRELVRHDLTRSAGRAVRQARVRAWWARAGSSPTVVVFDDRRPELRHYRPPMSRRTLGPEVVSDELTAAWWRQVLRSRFEVPEGARLVAGSGSPTWRSGLDQFVAAAAAGSPDDHYVWFLPRSSTMPAEAIHDARALGVEDRLHWMATPGDPAHPVVGCDVMVAAGRSVDASGSASVPLVTYGSSAVTAVAARPEQLAAAVDVLDDPVGRLGDHDLAEAVGWPATA